MEAGDEAPLSERATSQTLARGLRILEVLAATPEALSISKLALMLGLSRPIVYRLLYTLDDFHLVRRDAKGNYELGSGVSRLARGFSSSLQRAAAPELIALAEACTATAMLIAPDGDHAFVLASVEPKNAAFHVAFKPGSRDPINRGAGGLAILAGAPAVPGERTAVSQARKCGYALSKAEVVAGSSALAAPIVSDDGHVWGSLSILFAGDIVDEPRIAPLVIAAARRVAASLDH